MHSWHVPQARISLKKYGLKLKSLSSLHPRWRKTITANFVAMDKNINLLLILKLIPSLLAWIIHKSLSEMSMKQKMQTHLLGWDVPNYVILTTIELTFYINWKKHFDPKVCFRNIYRNFLSRSINQKINFDCAFVFEEFCRMIFRWKASLVGSNIFLSVR